LIDQCCRAFPASSDLEDRQRSAHLCMSCRAGDDRADRALDALHHLEGGRQRAETGVADSLRRSAQRAFARDLLRQIDLPLAALMRRSGVSAIH